MLTTELPGTGRRTSRLGFGCSSIMGALNRRDSRRALEWAYEAGIRHFDVAPMYGFGEAESCLGEFLTSHPGECTVTTKFGIPPEPKSRWKQAVRSLVRPMLKAVPGLKERAQRAASAVAAPAQPRNLSAVEAKLSLEQSLHKLRVERVDLYLLHDATPEELQGNDALLQFLKDSKAEGKIGEFGVGTERAHAEAILMQSPAFVPVLQREWSVFNVLDVDLAFHVTHRALAANQRRLAGYLRGAPEIAQEWSAQLNTDLRNDHDLSTMMIQAALWANPSGIVLFSSKNRQHIERNSQLGDVSDTGGRGEMLCRLVQEKLEHIPDWDAV